MSFWDSILGHRLAEVLIRELPKITKSKKQYVVTVEANTETVKAAIMKENENGSMLVTSMPLQNEILLVFEQR